LKHQQRQQESTTGNIAKIPFCDAIFPGQKIYHPKNGLLDVVTISGTRQIPPPASHWINPRGKRLAVATVFWEQHTKSTKKPVLGRNRVSRKVEKEKVLSLKQLASFLPPPLELVLQECCPPIPLSLNNLLGTILLEPGPIPNGRIVVQRNCYEPGYLFAIKMNESGKFLRLKGNNRVFAHSRACRSEGALCYALDTALKLSSEFIVDLLHGHKAQIQIQSQIDCPNGEYFLFHDNNGRVNGKQRVIAVAKKLSPTRFVLALSNSRYSTETMEYYYIDRK
jgi:uncharacterized protein Veg